MTLLSLSTVDWAILFIYLLFLAYMALKSGREGDSSAESYILAGRRLTLPSFIATTVATWYGGILGVGEYSYKHGLSTWFVFGVPYYLAVFLFAMLIAKRARESRMMTIPDQLLHSYDSKTAIGGALIVFIKTVPAAYILMLGVLLQLLFGWQLWFGVIVAVVISSGYVLIGGFRTVVKTDKLQFSLMYGSFIVILAILFARYGGLSFLRESVPATHFVWHGSKTAGYVISWYFIALSTLVEPAFYQRCFAAQTPQIAKRGLLISILFWFSFDFMTTTTGMFSRAILGDGIRAVNAFPLLADHILPPGLKGLFLVGLITTIQSTIDSYSFLAASTLGRDVLWRVKWIKRRIGQVGLSRWGLLVSGIVAVAIALSTDSVVDIWRTLGSIGTPALLLPLALSYSERFRPRSNWAFANMIIVPIVVGGWFLIQGRLDPVPFPFSIEPIYIGLGLSFALMIVDHLLSLRLKPIE
ncbi:MAG: sodium:solute symporter family protein [Candidatus Electryoneaceae bacterium]|nr:sodium:solute symporter family protein [Candidatus Electryoneaceae bacterium]